MIEPREAAQPDLTYILSSENGNAEGEGWPGPTFLFIHNGEVKYDMNHAIHGPKVIGRFNRNLIYLINYAEEVGKDKVFLRAECLAYGDKVDRLKQEIENFKAKLENLKKMRKPTKDPIDAQHATNKNEACSSGWVQDSAAVNSQNRGANVWERTKADILNVLRKSGLASQDHSNDSEEKSYRNKNLKTKQGKLLCHNIESNFKRGKELFVKISKAHDTLELMKEELEELKYENFKIRREMAKYSVSRDARPSIDGADDDDDERKFQLETTNKLGTQESEAVRDV
ncbi:unnamed protein product [Gordionus sp. m RMFG-2023]